MANAIIATVCLIAVSAAIIVVHHRPVSLNASSTDLDTLNIVALNVSTTALVISILGSVR